MRHFIAFLCMFFTFVQPAYSDEITRDHRFEFFDIKPGMTLAQAQNLVESHGGTIKAFSSSPDKRYSHQIYNFWAMVEIEAKDEEGKNDPRLEIMKKYQKIMPNASNDKNYQVVLHTYPTRAGADLSNAQNLAIYMIEANITQQAKKSAKQMQLPPHLAHLQTLRSTSYSFDEIVRRINQHGVLTEAMYQGNNENRFGIIWRHKDDHALEATYDAKDILELPYVENIKPNLETCLKSAHIAQSIESYAESDMEDLQTYFEKTLAKNPIGHWKNCGRITHASVLFKDKKLPPTGVTISQYNMEEVEKAYEGFVKYK